MGHPRVHFQDRHDGGHHLGLVAGVQGACVGDAEDGVSVSPEEVADLTCEGHGCDQNETCIVEGDAMGCVCEGDFHRDEGGVCFECDANELYP